MIGGIGLHFYIISQIDKKFGGIRHHLNYYWFVHILFGFVLSSFNVSLLKSLITGYIVGCVLQKLPSMIKLLPPHYNVSNNEKQQQNGCLIYIMMGWLLGEIFKHFVVKQMVKTKEKGSLLDTIGIDDFLIY